MPTLVPFSAHHSGASAQSLIRLIACCLLLLPWQVLALPTNLAPGGTSAGSSEGFGSVTKDANDGDRNGAFGAGSVWHTLTPAAVAGPYFYEVELPETTFLDRVMIWPRTDVLQNTVENFTLKVLDENNAQVWSQDYWPASAVGWAWGATGMRGVRGKKVRFERKDTAPSFITFAEFEVWGDQGPPTANFLRQAGVTLTASPPGFGTTIAVTTDGDLNANYANPTAVRSVYHSGTVAVGQFWQADLGQDRALDYLNIYSRQDSDTTATVLVRLLDATGGLLHSQTVNISRANPELGGARFSTTIDFPGVMTGRTIRIETTQNQYLALAEVEAFGSTGDFTPPRLIRRYPEPDSLQRDITSTWLEFSEAITGLEAGDLLINGVPATAVTMDSSVRARFSFVQPASGVVTFALASGHGIADAAGNGLTMPAWTLRVDATLPEAVPVITELLADNRGLLKDEDDDSPDWIEIYNPGPTALNLGGWYLAETPAFKTQWTFPEPTIIEAGEYLIVFCSSKNRSVREAELHTNFKLDQDGDSILLTHSDGTTVVSSILNFPAQFPNISYGVERTFAGAPVVGTNALGKLLAPATSSIGWQGLGFDDTSWASSTNGVGFDVTNGLGSHGPLGWWNFDDSTVITAAPDVSGNNRPGTVTNGVYSFNGEGRTGQAGDKCMVFNGNGVVSIPAAAVGAFDAIVARNALTISLWTFGAADNPRDHYTFLGSSVANGTGIRVVSAHLPWSDSVLYWDTAGCCETNRTRLSIGEPDANNWRGRWNHYVLLKNGDTKEIWINGQLRGTAQNTDPMVPLRSLYWGASSAVGALGYSGKMDDIAIWDGALNESQIAALSAGASPTSIRQINSLIKTNVAAAMHNVAPGAYLRLPFTAETGVKYLQLNMQYDDGFIAYLNGVEVARRNAPGSGTNEATIATTERPAGYAMNPESIDISGYASLLLPGSQANVLAIQGINASAADGDFFLQAELLAGMAGPQRYFAKATPEAGNATGYTGLTSDVHFSPQRGLYDAPMVVTLTCNTPQAILIYTTDGSEPSLTNGTQGPSPLSISISGTTNLRAIAVAGTLAPTNVDTHSYVYVNQVATQGKPTATPALWPGNYQVDYAMDTRVTNAPAAPGYSIRESLLALPTVCLTLPPADIWSTTGIYANSTARGSQWERAGSVEWMDPTVKPEEDGEAHASVGVRVHGNISRTKNFTPKHGFSLRFRGEYGDTRFQHKLFPDSDLSAFDEIILRAGSTDTFPCLEWAAVGLGQNGESYQRWNRLWASYIRDQWTRDTHLAMGQPAARGRYCHLYINGTYWGLYNLTEALGAQMMADHSKTNANDWDVVSDFNELRDGNRTAWDNLLALADGETLDTDAGLRRAMGQNPDGTPNPSFPVLLDAISLADYFVAHIYFGADDWPNHNWYAARLSRGATPKGFQFLTWDQEISNENVLYQRTSWGPIYAEANAAGTSSRIYSRLRNSPEFRRIFGDRVHKHLFGNGRLTRTASETRWNNLATGIDKAIVAESARWGDYQTHNNPTYAGLPYTRENTWLPHLNWMATNYWPAITNVALQRYRTANLYPAVEAPVPNNYGSLVNTTFNLTLTNPNAAAGQIIYTTDGSDPRLWGGSTSPTATIAAGTTANLTSLPAGTTLKARVLQGATWSALLESNYPLNPDMDADSLPDTWEIASDLSPTDPADAHLDSDGDGQTNLQEYAALTDPRAANSRFVSNTQFMDVDGLTLTFDRQPGRRYRIERTSDLAPGLWSTVRLYQPQAELTEQSWTDVSARQNSRFFYRVTVEVP